MSTPEINEQLYLTMVLRVGLPSTDMGPPLVPYIQQFDAVWTELFGAESSFNEWQEFYYWAMQQRGFTPW